MTDHKMISVIWRTVTRGQLLNDFVELFNANNGLFIVLHVAIKNFKVIFTGRY